MPHHSEADLARGFALEALPGVALHLRGAGAAFFVGGDGRGQRGSDFEVTSAGGSLRFEHAPGVVGALLERQAQALVGTRADRDDLRLGGPRERHHHALAFFHIRVRDLQAQHLGEEGERGVDGVDRQGQVIDTVDTHGMDLLMSRGFATWTGLADGPGPSVSLL